MSTEKKILISFGILTLIFIVAGVLILGKSGNQPANSQQIFDQSILLSNTRHAKGNPNAATKIVEFADFQCPACATAQPIIKKVLEQNQERAFFVFRHYPLSFHKNAKLAAQACEAAGEQGKFWEMHDQLFIEQSKWAESSNADEIFEGYAQGLGLDLERFKSDFEKVTDVIERDYADGNKVSVESTPTFFINGKKHPGVISESDLIQVINSTQ